MNKIHAIIALILGATVLGVCILVNILNTTKCNSDPQPVQNDEAEYITQWDNMILPGDKVSACAKEIYNHDYIVYVEDEKYSSENMPQFAPDVKYIGYLQN